MKAVAILSTLILAFFVAMPADAAQDGKNHRSARQMKSLARSCDVLEAHVSRATSALQRMTSKKKSHIAAKRKNLKSAVRAFENRCEDSGAVCGDVQQAECQADGADFCIQSVKEQDFRSMADLARAGATFLYAGECRSAGFPYGMPQYSGND